MVRFDERGIAKSSGNFSSASDVDFAEDILAGIDFARAHSVTFQVTNVGVIGHSKGAATALITANMSNLVKFLVFLGGPALTGESILYMQTRLILKADNHSDAYIEKIIDVNRGVYQILKRESDVNRIRAEFIIYFDNLVATSHDQADKDFYTEVKGSTLAQIDGISTPWFRSFLVFDPKNILEKTKIPILGLWGSNDLQVPAKENRDEMLKALEIAKNDFFKLEILTGLNHLFQESTTGSPSEYEKIEETFSTEALGMMSDWILNEKNIGSSNAVSFAFNLVFMCLISLIVNIY